MPKRVDPLSDFQCRAAKGRTAPYKLADGAGLFLLVNPDGSRYWRFNYRHEGKSKTLAMGVYPKIGLAEVRRRADRARETLAAGGDPSAERKIEKLTGQISTETRFELVAREWFERQRPTWVASHADRIIRRFERDIFPWIGARKVGEIKVPEVLAVLRQIQERGALETAHRAKSDVSQVFRYAVETGRRDERDGDPTAKLSSGALRPPLARSHGAITDPERFGELLRALHGHNGTPIVRAALRLAPLLFVRPGELRGATWDEINLDGGAWEIPAARMKRPSAEKIVSAAHIVPLSRQAVMILRELATVTGATGYVFPSARSSDRPMSENAVLAALRALGYSSEEATGHGFRASARTMIVERLKLPAEHVEMQLAHEVRDANGRAYNRVQFIAERTAMMQRWADYCDHLRAGGVVVPITEAA